MQQKREGERGKKIGAKFRWLKGKEREGMGKRNNLRSKWRALCGVLAAINYRRMMKEQIRIQTHIAMWRIPDS